MTDGEAGAVDWRSVKRVHRIGVGGTGSTPKPRFERAAWRVRGPG